VNRVCDVWQRNPVEIHGNQWVAVNLAVNRVCDVWQRNPGDGPEIEPPDAATPVARPQSMRGSEPGREPAAEIDAWL
jgi:hypothetical protein